MAWFNPTATSGQWKTVLDALEGSRVKVPASIETTTGVIAVFIVPSGWMGENMMNPLYRHTVRQRDLTSVTEYRALPQAAAYAAAQDASMNVGPNTSGGTTFRSSARAGRINEACGYSVTLTEVTTTVTETVEQL